MNHDLYQKCTLLHISVQTLDVILLPGFMPTGGTFLSTSSIVNGRSADIARLTPICNKHYITYCKTNFILKN